MICIMGVCTLLGLLGAVTFALQAQPVTAIGALGMAALFGHATQGLLEQQREEEAWRQAATPWKKQQAAAERRAAQAPTAEGTGEEGGVGAC